MPGVCLVLVGIISTTVSQSPVPDAVPNRNRRNASTDTQQYMPTNSVRVIAPMCVGFGLLIAFGFWETLSHVAYPLCPPRIFRSHNGREFTVPFIVAFIV